MTNFTIESAGTPAGLPRLVAKTKLSPGDFLAIAKALGSQPIRAKKTGFVSARRSTVRTEIETRWNGKESSITAEPGDWIVTNMTSQRELMRDSQGDLNVYAIRANAFPTLYAQDGGATPEGDIFRAISQVDVIALPGGFEIVPPWAKGPSDIQTADAGYLILSRDEVYGNAKETFEATYEFI